MGFVRMSWELRREKGEGEKKRPCLPVRWLFLSPLYVWVCLLFMCFVQTLFGIFKGEAGFVYHLPRFGHLISLEMLGCRAVLWGRSRPSRRLTRASRSSGFEELSTTSFLCQLCPLGRAVCSLCLLLVFYVAKGMYGGFCNLFGEMRLKCAIISRWSCVSGLFFN